jgi:hypothetical protein
MTARPYTPETLAADARRELLREALRFAVWAAGEGLLPADGETANSPECFLLAYSQATGDEDWDTLADRLVVP